MKFEIIGSNQPATWETLPRNKKAELFHARFQTLFEELSSLGTIVKIRSMVEARNDEPESKPEVWVERTNSAYVEIIFPSKTIVQSIRDSSYNLSDGQNKKYKAKRIDQDFSYDNKQVTGHLLLQYDSHDKVPLLHISDMLGQSDLDEAVCIAIQAAFAE